MKGQKATECNVRNQRMNIPSRNEVKNQKNKDFEETEDYEPTNDFDQKIIEIFSWTHMVWLTSRHRQCTPS
jgi:hypothetical protein